MEEEKVVERWLRVAAMEEKGVVATTSGRDDSKVEEVVLAIAVIAKCGK